MALEAKRFKLPTPSGVRYPFYLLSSSVANIVCSKSRSRRASSRKRPPPWSRRRGDAANHPCSLPVRDGTRHCQPNQRRPNLGRTSRFSSSATTKTAAPMMMTMKTCSATVSLPRQRSALLLRPTSALPSHRSALPSHRSALPSHRSALSRLLVLGPAFFPPHRPRERGRQTQHPRLLHAHPLQACPLQYRILHRSSSSRSPQVWRSSTDRRSSLMQLVCRLNPA
jgi:hypothetical protein